VLCTGKVLVLSIPNSETADCHLLPLLQADDNYHIFGKKKPNSSSRGLCWDCAWHHLPSLALCENRSTLPHWEQRFTPCFDPEKFWYLAFRIPKQLTVIRFLYYWMMTITTDLEKQFHFGWYKPIWIQSRNKSTRQTRRHAVHVRRHAVHCICLLW